MDLNQFPLHSADKDELLIRLSEEASEVVKEACKCLRFGFEGRWPRNAKSNNKERLFHELQDLEIIARELRRRYGS